MYNAVEICVSTLYGSDETTESATLVSADHYPYYIVFYIIILYLLYCYPGKGIIIAAQVVFSRVPNRWI